MAQTGFRGTGAALVTPFTEHLEVDYFALHKILEHTASLDYWVVQGTTGETSTLNEEEKTKALDYVLTHKPAGKKVVLGFGGNNTAELLASIGKIKGKGLDGILSVSPYYSKPSQKGIVAHFKAIADASPVPVILYNVPSRTGSNMKAETTLELAEHGNIVAIKEASGDLSQCIEIAAHKPANFQLISGDDMLTVPMIAIGAEGLISVMANAFPDDFTNMINLALANDYAAASKILYKFTELNPLMYEEGNPVGVKHCMELLGVCKPFVRMPLAQATDTLRQRISAAMKKMK